jgi:hypothetical protein
MREYTRSNALVNNAARTAVRVIIKSNSKSAFEEDSRAPRIKAFAELENLPEMLNP